MIKGIILAGGVGTRLFPITKGASKQLLPIYDKPMIYYPLSVLMLSDIRDVLIISTSEDLPRFKNVLGNGSDIGMKFEYIVQPSPDGLAQAFILGKEFIGTNDVCLILGDNIYYGDGFSQILKKATLNTKKERVATVFGYHVQNPKDYGVVNFDQNGNVIKIEEKPKEPKSNYAVTGLYFYPNDVIKKALKIRPSHRGELEITDINQIYLNENRLSVELLSKDFAWLDTGTHERLLEASRFIEALERKHGVKVACIEEIAFSKGYINKTHLRELAKPMQKNQYGQYLFHLVEQKN